MQKIRCIMVCSLLLLPAVWSGAYSQETPAQRAWTLRLSAIRPDDLMQMLRDLKAITDTSRAESQYWGRIAGSRADHETAAWLQERFASAGFNEIDLIRIPYYRNLPKSWSVVLPGAVGFSSGIELESAFPVVAPWDSVQREFSLQAELAPFGTGTEIDFHFHNTREKIALVDSRTIQGSGIQTGGLGVYQRAVDHGAVGVLMTSDMPGNHASAARMYYELPQYRQAPAFMIGRRDGERLWERILQVQSGSPIWIEMDFAYDAKQTTHTYNVVAWLPGKTPHTVVVTAYIDSYFEGASDNASGLAGLVALAAYVEDIPQEYRQKSYVFAALAGRESGDLGMQAFLNTPDDRWQEIDLFLSLDKPAGPADHFVFNEVMPQSADLQRILWISNRNPRLLSYFGSVLSTYNLQPVMETPPPFLEMIPGDMRLAAQRAPAATLTGMTSWHRTTADTIDRIPPEQLERVVKAYATLLARIDGTPQEVLRESGKITEPVPLPDLPWPR